jgi:hypothetical protein
MMDWNIRWQPTGDFHKHIAEIEARQKEASPSMWKEYMEDAGFLLVICGAQEAMLESGFTDEAKAEVIQEFVAEVERRAERKMEITHKLEGAHYAAMKELAREKGDTS